jgi:hypothetical protein
MSGHLVLLLNCNLHIFAFIIILLFVFCRIQGFHTAGYEMYTLVGYDTVDSAECQSMFRRYISSSSSGLNKPSKITRGSTSVYIQRHTGRYNPRTVILLPTLLFAFSAFLYLIVPCKHCVKGQNYFLNICDRNIPLRMYSRKFCT